jgi:hypothetical protein
MLYNKEDLEKIIFFHVETCPKFYNLGDLLENGKTGEIEKVERMAENQNLSLKSLSDAEQEDFFSSLALVPELNRILCISFGQVKFEREANKISNKYKISTKSYSSLTNEDTILESAFKAFDNERFVLGGFNIISFGIPLVQKHYLQRGQLPKNLVTLGKKPWDVKVLDLCNDWKGTSGYMTSLSLLCDFLGIKNKKGTVTSKNIFNKILDDTLDIVELEVCCELDVTNCIESCIKLSF